jgi:hypothetical protein
MGLDVDSNRDGFALALYAWFGRLFIGLMCIFKGHSANFGDCNFYVVLLNTHTLSLVHGASILPKLSQDQSPFLFYRNLSSDHIKAYYGLGIVIYCNTMDNSIYIAGVFLF